MRRALSTVARHRPMMKLNDKRPAMQNDAWVAPTASVIGDVYLGVEASVWYGAVIRGDRNSVKIKKLSNVQEKAVSETVESVDTGFPAVVAIGEQVNVSPGGVLVSCTVGNNVKLGAGTVVMEGALVEDNVTLMPGSMVPRGARIPTGEVWAGSPAEFVSKMSDDDMAAIHQEAQDVAVRARDLALEYLPPPDAP